MTAAATDLGRLVPPYPVEHCGNADCSRGDGLAAFEAHGAYAYRDLDTGRLVVFCGDCARWAELVAWERFKVLPL